MAKIIEAKAIISGEEKLSPILDKLAKKLKEVQKTAKTSEGVDKMAAALGRVNRELTAIEKFNAAKLGFRNAANDYRRTQEAVRSTARAMREGGGDARKLAREYQRAQEAAARASRVYEAQRGAFAAAKRGMQELGSPLRNVTAEQNRLAAAVERANVALTHQQRRAGRLRTVAGNVATTLGFIAGPGILHGTRKAVESGAHIQSEIVKMRAAGIPEAEIQMQAGESAEFAAKYPNVKRSDILERYKELRSVLSHPDETPALMDIAIRTNSALNALDPSGQAAEGLQYAFKAAEVEGMAQDPKRFAAAMEAFVKSVQVMGKTISPELILTGAQQLKASAALLSDRFKWTTYLSMLQEMGPRAGAGVNQMVAQLIGDFHSNHAAAKEWVSMGLARDEDFIHTKTGSIKGLKPGHHVQGWKTGMSAPDWWVRDYLIPSLAGHGYSTEEEQIAEVMRLFPNKRASNVVAKMIQQMPSYETHARLYQKAQGTEAVLDTNRSDPFNALNSWTTALSSFAGTLTSPMMQSAAGVLSGMASTIGSWGQALERWQKANPTTAQIAGGAAVAGGVAAGGILTYNLVSGLMSGFGLKASAAALDGSALALTRAAAALGGSSAVTATAGGAGGGVARGVLGTVLGTAAGAAGIYFGSTEEANAGERDIYARNPKTGKMELTDYGRSLQLGGGQAPVEAELKGSAEVTGEAKVTIDIPGLATRTVNVPLRGTLNANGPGSLGVSSPDAAAAPVGAP